MLALALLILSGPRLLAAGANNLASLALAPEWQAVQQAPTIPRCEAGRTPPAPGTLSGDPFLSLAARWDPTAPRVNLNLGRAAWLAGDCVGAWVFWERALEADPDDEMAALWLFWAAGARPEAVPPPLDGETLAGYTTQAGRRAGKVAPEAAKNWYELSLALAPGRETAEALARARQSAGDAEGARAVWQELAARLPETDADHWWARARAAEMEGEWDTAAQAYGQGASRASEPYEYWMRQGQAYGRLARPKASEGAYHRAIEACPTCLSPYLQLGHLWRAHDQPAGALNWYDEAARVAPRSASPPYYRAQALYEVGEGTLAIEALEQALDLHRGQPWRWVMQLGDWRLEGGDREGALAAYRQALEWAPGEAAIRERIEGGGD